ncbi:MAG TPA: hypothetical protein VFQ40_04795 [Actinomycetota bacterium]|nr:hypothetical protein [Actinomycetota bacterium]
MIVKTDRPHEAARAEERADIDGGDPLKRAVSAILVILAVLAFLPPHGNAGVRPWRYRECRFQTVDGRWGWTESEVKLTIRCLANKLNVDVSMAMMVASHESGFDANPSNPVHCGVYQHTRSYFDGRIDAAARRWPGLRWISRDCESARSNTLAAFYLVKTDGWFAHWCRWVYYC